MNIEFHYYTVYYLASRAGFTHSDASVLAISSQLVDECVSPWRIGHDEDRRQTRVTQNYIFWDESVARGIYRPFHFIPGDRETARRRRIDGQPGPRVVTPDSPIAREILIEALHSRNLYRIGIALHGYADTWAHQDFSGDSEPQNALEKNSPVPAAGHLHALRNPDVPGTTWRDPRLKPEFAEIRNAERFSHAAKMTYRFLSTYNRRPFLDEEFIIGPLGEIWNGTKSRDSSGRAADYIVSLDVPPYETEIWARQSGGAAADYFGSQDPFDSGYDKFSWLKNAARKTQSALGAIRGAIPAEGFANSAFERWNQAVQAHLEFCHKTFRQRGIE